MQSVFSILGMVGPSSQSLTSLSYGNTNGVHIIDVMIQYYTKILRLMHTSEENY
jgi:hypothetical protein